MPKSAPFAWFGGKGHMTPKLLKYVPEHKFYLEPFGGAASLLLNKKPAKFEVYNDLDSGLVNFFRILRDKEKFEKFYEKCVLSLYSREEYNFCRKTWRNCKDEIEKAYRWWIVARMSFSGRFEAGWNFAVTEIRRSMPQTVSKFLSSIKNLPEIVCRFQRVQIEHLDWKECIEKYCSAWKYEESFVYLDPPYIESTRRAGKYQIEFSDEQHEDLIKYLIKTQNRTRYMLSGYDNELYKILEQNNWKKICWNVACYAVGKIRQAGIQGKNITFKKNQRRIECIWINYDINNNNIWDNFPNKNK